MMLRYDSDATMAAKNSAGRFTTATPISGKPAQQMAACSTTNKANSR